MRQPQRTQSESHRVGLAFSDIGIARRHVRLGDLHDDVFLEMFFGQ